MSLEANIDQAPPEILKETLHPNRIGFAGLLAQVTSLAVEAAVGTYIGSHGAIALGGKVFGIGSDIADGKIARRYPHHLRTKKGAIIDPLFDKIGTYTTALYIFSQYINPTVVAGYAANAIVDYMSTKQRGPLKEQFKQAIQGTIDPRSCEVDSQELSQERANVFGKAKVCIQNMSGLALLAEELVYLGFPELANTVEKELYRTFIGYFLMSSALMGAQGINKRKGTKTKK